MFRRYPEAEAVAIRLDVYALPSMEGYRNGVVPKWKTLYRARFERGRNGPST